LLKTNDDWKVKNWTKADIFFVRRVCEVGCDKIIAMNKADKK
jgi:hypothetical protein